MSTELSPYALLSVEELNEALDWDAGNAEADQKKVPIINAASAEIEGWLDRHLVTRSTIGEDDAITNPLVEYHWAPGCGEDTLWLGEWPVISVVSVYEDPNWSYAATVGARYPATTLLTEGTHYDVRMPTREPAPFGRLVRLSGAAWTAARRGVRVTYAAGYANTAAVPAILKDVCIELCALKQRDRARGEVGVLTRTDGMGTVTRHLPAVLTEQMKSRLRASGYRPRTEFAFGETWERDAA